MASTLSLSAYDLSDEGPLRPFNEDATLVREDLGLFAVADGAGGRGKGEVAAALALRTLENYVGATVRSAHDSTDHDRLGNPEQAKRLSRAVHRAHHYLLEAQKSAPERKGMATTLTALLLAPRTGQLHIAHVGNSRCYRLRHGRLELLTEDHDIARDVLERRPETADSVLVELPEHTVVRALGMEIDLRVSIRSLWLAPSDRFLLCSDGLASALSFDKIWRILREPSPLSAVASELLSHALDARSPDNVSLVVIDCNESILDENLPTRPYNEIPPPSRPRAWEHELGADEDEDVLPLSQNLAWDTRSSEADLIEAVESWGDEEEPPTAVIEEKSGVEVTLDFIDRPAIEISPHSSREPQTRELQGPEEIDWNDEPPPSFTVSDEDLELEPLDGEEAGEPPPSTDPHER